MNLESFGALFHKFGKLIIISTVITLVVIIFLRIIGVTNLKTYSKIIFNTAMIVGVFGFLAFGGTESPNGISNVSYGNKMDSIRNPYNGNLVKFIKIAIIVIIIIIYSQLILCI